MKTPSSLQGKPALILKVKMPTESIFRIRRDSTSMGHHLDGSVGGDGPRLVPCSGWEICHHGAYRSICPERMALIPAHPPRSDNVLPPLCTCIRGNFLPSHRIRRGHAATGFFSRTRMVERTPAERKEHEMEERAEANLMEKFVVRRTLQRNDLARSRR
jgi:hypothetical protein